MVSKLEAVAQELGHLKGTLGGPSAHYLACGLPGRAWCCHSTSGAGYDGAVCAVRMGAVVGMALLDARARFPHGAHVRTIQHGLAGRCVSCYFLCYITPPSLIIQ